MSWLGGSISTITGQLSNFTKDILTEGTEEVSDHVTELHLAQGKIRDLEGVITSLKSENDWLKRLNKEFEERAESSELQINSISREYRGVLEEKEKENQSLRQKHQELEEIHVKTIVSKEKNEIEAPVYYGSSSSSSHREPGCTDELDFGENISLQYEVNQLRGQVHRLKSECQHWKTVASQMGSEGNESAQLLANIAKLQTCNNELQQQLQKEKESRRDEVAALQNMFSQKIALLKKAQKEELDADNIDPIDQHEKSADNKLQSQLEVSEKEISKLQEKVSHLEKELQLSEETVSELTKTLSKADKEIEKLTQETQEVEELRQLKVKHEETIKELSANSTLDSPKDDLEKTVEPKTELPQTSASNLQDSAADQINGKQQSSPSKTQLLDEKVSTLQKQVQKYEQEIEQFEYMKSDWQTEKEALEEVLLGLRNQLKEKEASLNVAQAQRGLAEVEEQEMDENMSFETHIANDEISYFKGRLSTLEEKYMEKNKNEKALKEKLKNSESLVGEKEVEIERLTAEKLDVQNSLEELDAQHQEVVGQLIEIRNELNKKLKNKTDEIEQLTKEMESVKLALQEANEDFSKQKEEVEKAHSNLSETKKELNDTIEDLKEKLQKGAYVVNELHMDKTEMSDKMAELKSRAEELAKQNGHLKEQLRELTLEIKSSNSEELQLENKNLMEKVEQLTGRLNEQIETKQKDDKEIADQKNKCLKLEEELDQLKNENSVLNNKYSILNEKYQNYEKPCEAHTTVSIETEEDLQYEIENLIADKNTLLKYISDVENVFTDYISNSKKLCTSEESEEHSRIDKLETCVQTLKSKLKISEKGCKLDSECDFTNLLNEKEKENDELKSEISVLQKERGENFEVVEQYAVTLNRIEELEGELNVLKQTNAELRKEMEVLVSFQEDQDSKESQSSQSQTLGLITDLESELVLSRNEIKSLQETVYELQHHSHLSPDDESSKTPLDFDNEDFSKEQKCRISQLEAEVDRGQKNIMYFQNMLQEIASAVEIEKIKKLDGQVVRYLKQLQEEGFDNELNDDKNQDDFDEEKNDHNIRDPESSKCYKDKKVSSAAHYHEANNVDEAFMVNNCNNDHSQDMEQLQHIVAEKDNVIQELQNNNSMLLNMIENKSISVYGDKSLLELHQLSKDVKNLRSEKEQMMAVMDDKSRECSTLKAEVNRLMATISEERNALDRLHSENQRLLESKSSISISEDSIDAGSMQKEALQKLSNIIRDKDVEIDALKQKNETLLTIFQDSSQNGPQINSLIHEKENLKKELTLLQSERDQIGSYLNQKHSESVAYHGEIQRLNAYIKNEAEKFDKLKQEHEKLMPLFEDKNQLLIKTQNELVNYKQKYSEMEVKYEELFQRSNASEVIDIISYNSKVEETNTLNERLMKLQNNLAEQEQKLQNLLQKNVELENSLREMEMDKNNAKKQVDSLQFQLSEANAKLNDSQSEMASSKQQSSEQNVENSTLKEINNKLSLTIQQKEFELRNMTEKANTMTVLLQKQQGKESQIDVLIKESEVIRQHALQFQQERDQIILSLKQVQAEKEEMMKELHKLREKDVKQTRELERLRMHLLQIEEGYTKEALESEEREKDLRNKLAAAEEKAFSATAAAESASQATNYQVENLNQQLHVIASQRDNAYLQLGTLQEQCKQYATSLMNLQIVLEQFQVERETQMTAEKEKNESEQKRLNKLVGELQAELDDTKEN